MRFRVVLWIAGVAASAIVNACGQGTSPNDQASAPTLPTGSSTATTPPSSTATSPVADAGTVPHDAAVTDAHADAPSYDAAALVAARPYNFRVPVGYDPTHPTPLVVALHGYANSGTFIDNYFGLGTLVDSEGFLYAYPDGSLDLAGNRFWNATDACCNLTFQNVDDVAYLNAILDDVESKYNVDPKRIFFAGHSNGAFMSHRFACDASTRVAAIASLGGAQWFDATKCNPSSPVSVLEVHGDADGTINYNGGFAAALYPSAHQTVATWATKNGCTGVLTSTGTLLDVDTAIAGNETRVDRYGGCTNADVELWTVQGGPHIPPLASTWAQTIYGFLSAHPKP